MTRKILLVDDDERILMLLREVLRLSGYETIEARGGIEAVSKVKSERPILVLMDVHMPDMDGFEAIKKIREDRASLGMKVVAVTACAVHGDREKCIDGGFDDYISKPFAIKSVVEKVRELVGE